MGTIFVLFWGEHTDRTLGKKWDDLAVRPSARPPKLAFIVSSVRGRPSFCADEMAFELLCLLNAKTRLLPIKGGGGGGLCCGLI